LTGFFIAPRVCFRDGFLVEKVNQEEGMPAQELFV